jgi:hypothetical protein
MFIYPVRLPFVMDQKPKMKDEGLEKVLENLRGQFEDFRACGEECPGCNSDKTFAYNIQDMAISIHYVNDEAEFICSDCGEKWSGQYGYKGLA